MSNEAKLDYSHPIIEGRTGRSSFTLGMIGLLGSLLALNIIFGIGVSFAPLVIIFVQGVSYCFLFYFIVIQVTKRAHDYGSHGIFLNIVLGGLNLLFFSLYIIISFESSGGISVNGPPEASVAIIVTAVLLLPFIHGISFLLLGGMLFSRKGNDVINMYGPPPPR